MQRWGSQQQKNNGVRGMRPREGAVRNGFIGVVILLAGLLTQALGCADDSIDPASQTGPTAVADTLDARSAFIGAVLADTEDCWTEQFQSMDGVYVKPALVLFDGVAPVSAGVSAAATGSFYSATGRTIYVDLSFYRGLQEEYAALGDAAQAYVVAHEVGHAVQDQLGVLDRVEAEGFRASELAKSQLLLRTELQADFYAGLAARYQGETRWMGANDIDEAIDAVRAVGSKDPQDPEDEWTIPDAFTHGTRAQRVRWFMLGYETGDIERGDTFSVPYGEL